jgi:hypothetical protein
MIIHHSNVRFLKYSPTKLQLACPPRDQLAPAMFMSLVLLGVVASIFSPLQAIALPRRDDNHENPRCSVKAGVSASLNAPNQSLQGDTAQISATDAKVFVTTSDCDETMYPLSGFTWELVSKPAGSTVTLGRTNQLISTLVLDRVGDYRVRFVACPNGCQIEDSTKVAPKAVREITLKAVGETVVPPVTEPVLPSLPATTPTSFPTANAKCQNGGGLIDPQWVTVNPWRGMQDYELVEGAVYRSRFTGSDNPLNHDSYDHNFYVVPDLPYRRILSQRPEDPSQPNGLGIEWESDHFPEMFRPTTGDRTSVFGYWIHDCGHEPFYTEIHPPVGVATHRPRPILVPSSQSFNFNGTSSPVGANVYIPGIVTDIFFNRKAGEITNNCSRSGLHQPSGGDCIREPSPINRKFTFNIYLPENPQNLLAARGRTVPPVPLYIKTLNPLGSAGPEPIITVKKTGNVTYLSVELDLANFPGDRYSRKILAGWVYANPNNWGLQRWKVRINSLDVSDDGDGLGRGDGDWRFWVNTNNGSQEWTKLFDCDDCVSGQVTFKGRPWETGATSSDRNLGPDLLLFPNQSVWLHASGYEDDPVTSNGIGNISDRRLQMAANYQSRGNCDDCADYTMNYQVLAGSPIASASLSAPAKALFDRYIIRPLPRIDPRIPDLDPQFDIPVGGPVAPPVGQPPLGRPIGEPQPVPRRIINPSDIFLAPGAAPLPLNRTILFRPRPVETFAFQDASIDTIRAVLTSQDPKQQGKITAVLKQLRTQVDQLLLKQSKSAEMLLELQDIKAALPPELWRQYFGDLEPRMVLN